MSKIIKNYGQATCLSAIPVHQPTSANWMWRLAYVCQTGELLLKESETKHPGKQFLYFSSTDPEDDWYLRTGCGELITEKEFVKFTTGTSIYTFRLNL